MNLFKNKIRKSARHLFLLSTCLIMVAGMSSCSNESSVVPVDAPIGTDDASLLAWQMEKFVNTRSASFDIALVTTSTKFEFYILICNGDYSIDWGDGTVENNTKSHTYTDGLPAHTIFIYGDFNGPTSKIYPYGKDLIYADISRSPGLKYLAVSGNRLTNIDLSKNTDLEHLFVSENNLSNIDLSNVLNLKNLCVDINPITNIDVTKFPHLRQLHVGNTLIKSIDLSNNKELITLGIHNLPITSIDIKNFPNLLNFYCSNCPIDNLDFSQNTTIGVLECDGTNITTLDLSKAKELDFLSCNNCKINDITFNPDIYRLFYIDIKNNPIEQNIRKMTNLALSLPDRSATTPGEFRTSTPHLSTVISLLEGYNWDINPQ